MSICISNHNRANNRYDYMIMSVIFTLVAGNLGGALQPIRLIGLFSLPFVMTFIYNNKLRWKKNELISSIMTGSLGGLLYL